MTVVTSPQQIEKQSHDAHPAVALRSPDTVSARTIRLTSTNSTSLFGSTDCCLWSCVKAKRPLPSPGGVTAWTWPSQLSLRPARVFPSDDIYQLSNHKQADFRSLLDNRAPPRRQLTSVSIRTTERCGVRAIKSPNIAPRTPTRSPMLASQPALLQHCGGKLKCQLTTQPQMQIRQLP